ncbi:hypothetical protein Ae168Ps1_0068c [Pseudonocardia sp. Ae168_Ps1]|nr:hypothetical protein Ae150APs1_0065c [Pseudonocardia sp. Ae150A_Ps1]OLL77662.1 hypothetical protein Ae168Ps1_0068c [Pseudonocardia sp. Ae168_Ps1]OLL88214.1 hypothetical protein Ae263Ps1_5269 [Pseudonocardia sp. Ae263_Ps1]OLL91755.1 hypothetical protein Ae356Ps1_1652c [Pseudonocardia sp. Ae356_Ps1]
MGNGAPRSDATRLRNAPGKHPFFVRSGQCGFDPRSGYWWYPGFAEGIVHRDDDRGRRT